MRHNGTSSCRVCFTCVHCDAPRVMTSAKLPGREPSRLEKRTRPLVFLYVAAGLIVALLGGGASETGAQVQQHAEHPLGKVDFRITCSEQAQVEFNRAVALLHHMTYP